jgi:hypothetical protein
MPRKEHLYGLTDQPAMDHLLNNSDNPVPSAADQPEEADSADEESEDLKIHVKKTGASEELMAKVRLLVPNHSGESSCIVRQMLGMRQDLPIDCDGQLPR